MDPLPTLTLSPPPHVPVALYRMGTPSPESQGQTQGESSGLKKEELLVPAVLKGKLLGTLTWYQIHNEMLNPLSLKMTVPLWSPRKSHSEQLGCVNMRAHNFGSTFGCCQEVFSVPHIRYQWWGQSEVDAPAASAGISGCHSPSLGDSVPVCVVNIKQNVAHEKAPKRAI